MAQAGDFSDLTNIDLGQVYRGVDISHYNKSVNWTTLSDKIDFCIIKLSDGKANADDYSQTHAQGAASVGKAFGFYHFARPESIGGESVEDNAKAQASFVMGLLTDLQSRGINAKLPLCLDLEDIPPRAATATKPARPGWDTNLGSDGYLLWIKTFIAGIFDPVANPLKPALYGRQNYLDQHLPDGHGLGAYPLWLSRYNADAANAVPAAGWDDWDGWQFSETGLLLPDEDDNADDSDFNRKDLDVWRISKFVTT
jgi:lysozyme